MGSTLLVPQFHSIGSAAGLVKLPLAAFLGGPAMEKECNRSCGRDGVMRREASAMRGDCAVAAFLTVAVFVLFFLVPRQQEVAPPHEVYLDTYPPARMGIAIALSKKAFEDRRDRYVRAYPDSDLARTAAYRSFVMASE
jgi:hypothetical protein